MINLIEGLLIDIADRATKHYLLDDSGPINRCECCSEESPLVELCPSHTRYHWDGQGDDPNRDMLLCPDCALQYTQDIQDKWNDYYSGIL